MGKSLNERMEEAGLKDLMPGFDKAAEWKRLHARLHPANTHPLPIWKVAAAIVLLIAAGGMALLINNSEREDSSNKYAANTILVTNWADGILPPVPEQHPAIAGNNNLDYITVRQPKVNNNNNSLAETAKVIQGMQRAGEFVCNSTPCPIEICITQIMKCGNGTSSAITSCSIVDPDQARQMRFKTDKNTGSNCKVEIEEICIKRVATGETIVLNAHSQPSTAQELFDCLTGNMDCNLMAGIFKNDCNNERRPGKLKIERDAGSLILE